MNEFKAKWGYVDDEVAGSHMVSRAGWTDDEHRAGRRLPAPLGSLGQIVALTPDGSLELDDGSGAPGASEGLWSEA